MSQYGRKATASGSARSLSASRAHSDCGVQVVALVVEKLVEGLLLFPREPDEVRARPIRKVEEVLGVRTADVLGGSRFVEPLGGVLANRLEEPVARHVLTTLRHDERGLDEAPDQVEGACIVAVQADRGDCLEREAAGEHRERRQHRALLVRKELVAPVERRSEGLVPWIGDSAPRA